MSRWPTVPKSIAWLFARFITVNPASRRSGAYEGGARNAKHDESPGAPHFEEPRFVSVPSRFPQTTSPLRSRRTDLKYDSTGPCTIAMSPANAKRTTGCFAAPPEPGSEQRAREHQQEPSPHGEPG